MCQRVLVPIVSVLLSLPWISPAHCQPAAQPTVEQQLAQYVRTLQFERALGLCLTRTQIGRDEGPARAFLEEAFEGCLMQDQAQFAEEQFRQWVHGSPESAEARAWLGAAMAAQPGRDDEAEAEYTKALELDPNCAEASFRLAALCQRQGKDAEAQAKWQRFLQLKPDSDRAWLVRHGLAVVDQTNVTTGLGFDSARTPAWSPDGKKIAFSAGEDRDLWSVEVATGAIKRLTQSRLNDLSVDWSPDGTEILFTKRDEDYTQSWLYRVAADGTGRERKATARRLSSAGRWSPSGRRILFRSEAVLWLMEADGTGSARLPLDALYGPYQQWPAVYTMPSYGPTDDTLVCQQVGEQAGEGTFVIIRLGERPQEKLGYFLWGRNQFPRMSPDGRSLVFARETQPGIFGVYVLPVPVVDAGEEAPVFPEKPNMARLPARRRKIGEVLRPICLTRCWHQAPWGPQPVWSPDGRAVAYSRPLFGDIWIAHLGGLATRPLGLTASRRGGDIAVRLVNATDTVQTVDVRFELFDAGSIRLGAGTVGEGQTVLEPGKPVECPLAVDVPTAARIRTAKLTADTGTGQRVVELVDCPSG